MTLCIAKNITKITLTTALLLIVVVACNRSSMQPPMYGVKIQYVQGQPLNYPDVTLEFVGKRETPATSDYPRSTIFYDFKVYQGNQAQLISWSAGTGDIGPTLFELDGNRYRNMQKLRSWPLTPGTRESEVQFHPRAIEQTIGYNQVVDCRTM